MKKTIFFSIILLAGILTASALSMVPFIGNSNEEASENEELTDKLKFVCTPRASGENVEESVLFTGDDILFYKVKTGEIVFTDSVDHELLKIGSKLFNCNALSVYLNDILLFEKIELFTPVESRTTLDLEFRITFNFYGEFKLYFGFYDYYWSENNSKAQEENKEKRKAEWDIFIKYFSDRNKIIYTDESDILIDNIHFWGINNDNFPILFFTANDIQSFNLKTGEVAFVDSINNKFIKNIRDIYDYWFLNGYFDIKPSKYLFQNISFVKSFTYWIWLHNDLIFFYDDIEKKFYFQDGYPPIDSINDDSFPYTNKEQIQKERDENMLMRKAEWDFFIQHLSDKGKIITSIEEVKTESPIQIYSTGKTIHINNETGKNGVISVYRIDGVKVSEQTMTSQTTTIEIPVSGFYLVSVKEGNEKPVMEKVIVR